jgi:peptidoglycan L-alanyl-D-glutamate endopeptidase CwlK
MTTLSSEDYKEHQNWQAYEDISTGDKRADANIASLDPRVQNQMKAVVLELKLRNGIDIRGAGQGGFRTYAEQDAIFARGASKAKGGQSNHNFAIAMDVAIFENGKYLNKGSEWQYKTYGNVAKKQGLMWGGNWKSFFDPAHIEYKHNSTMKELRALPKDKNGFFITLP